MRAAATQALRSEGVKLVSALRASSLHTTALGETLAETRQQEQQQPQAARHPPSLPPPPPASSRLRSGSGSGASSSTALTVQRPPESLLQRTFAAALEAVHRVVMLVGVMRHASASEAYVQRYLERELGMDSFSLQYLHVTRRGIFRLSVAKQIETVVAWLRSQGIRGEELAELVRHTPSVLSASVDEQLEPLADLLRWAGGSPADVLRCYPGLAAVPVAHLQGTRHVLRQLGVADDDLRLLLVQLPDLAAQLADTLHRLFQDFSRAAWKLAARQRRQLAGMVHHHMMHWNNPRNHAGGAGAAGDGGSSSGGGSGSGSDVRGPPHPQHSHLRGAGGGHRRPAPGSRLLPTSLLLEPVVFQRLKRVQAGIEALSLQEESPDDWEAAVAELAAAIDALGELSRAAEEARN